MVRIPIWSLRLTLNNGGVICEYHKGARYMASKVYLASYGLVA